jgi:invasion protein IalB
MSGWMDALKALRRMGLPALLAGCALGLGVVAAAAQQAQEVPKSSTYVPPKEATKEESSWVKICTKGDDAVAKQVCLVRHEGLEPKTGQIMIAAAVRFVEGDPKHLLLINLPTAYSLVIPTGVQIKVDDGEPVPLQYTVCLKTSCQVELELSKDLLAKMRKGNKLLVAAMNTQGKTMAFPIPLTGFGKTADGQPVDNVAYQAARMQMIEAARERQKQATSGAP